MAREAAIRARPGRLGLDTIALAVVSLGLVGAVLTDTSLPLISGDRAALVALALIGLALCTRGPLDEVASTGAWTSPMSIVGTVLGLLALAVVAAGLGVVTLPAISDDRSAFVALGAVMLVKLGVGALHRLLARRSSLRSG